MSDGPHSLPMRRAWRRVAERGDKRSYTPPEEISQALVPAPEQHWRDDMSPEFLVGIRRVVEEPSLFSHDVAAWLQALRPLAGSGIGRAVLDNVHLLSAEEANGFTVVQEAVKAALVDRANRGARQHSIEWEAFMLSLGPNSFLADWALRGRA